MAMRPLSFLLLCLVASAGCDDAANSAPAGGGTPDPSRADQGVTGDGAFVSPEGVSLTITQPLEGALLATRSLTVKGTYVGTPAAIMVDGVSARLVDGLFDATITVEDGPRTIVATGGGATAQVTVTIDATPPDVVIDAPQRGRWQAAGDTALRFTAEDESGLARVTINERDVPPGRGPTFDEPFTLPEGLNVLGVAAYDTAGNVGRESVSVLVGETRDPALPVSSAFRLRVGARGLTGIGQVAARAFDALDLTTLLPTEPIEVLGVLIELVGAEHAPGTTIDLTADGDRLAAYLRVERLVVDVTLEIDGNRYPLSLRAAAIEARALVSPTVLDGQIRTGITDLQVELEGFSVDLAGVPPFGGGGNAEETSLEAALETMATAFAVQYVPSVVDDALADFQKTFDLELLDVGFEIELVPEAVAVSGGGLLLRAGAAVRLTQPPLEAEAIVPGYLGRPSAWDDAPETEDVALAIDDDFLNLFLYQFWRSGRGLPVIDRAFLATQPTAADLVLGFLGGLVQTAWPDLPANTPFLIEPKLPLPPFVRVQPGQTGAGLSVAVGDLGVHVKTDDANARSLIDGAASLVFVGDVRLEPGAQGAGPTLALELSSTVATFDVLNPELRGAVEATLESPVLSLLEVLGETLPDLVSGLPLPGVGTLPVTDLSVGVAGPSGDFLRLDARIAP
ncbi:MAG: hypothetical protein ACOYM9_01770 [Bradymonadia bacterium]